MAEDREAQRVLDALEHYVAGLDGRAAMDAMTAAVRRAFLVGVTVGRALARDDSKEAGRHVGPLG
jgi:hypothetical protein